jgi:hypothetical protein
MAETLPAVIERRWTREERAAPQRILFSRRVRIMLILTSVLMLIAGGAAGVMAWWRPLVAPTWVVLAIARDDTTTIERGLAIAGDAHAMMEFSPSKNQNIIRTTGLTRRECEQMLAGLHLVRMNDRLCLYLTGAAGLNARGEVVFFPSDIAPNDPEDAIALADVLTDMERCQTNHCLLILDLSSVASSSLEVMPSEGVREALDRMLTERNLKNLLVIVSASSDETLNYVPGQCRSVFGLFAERAIKGHADGCNPQAIRDGRVSLTEFVAYLTTRVPSFTLHACGQQQRPICYGHVEDFELAVAEPIKRLFDEFETPQEQPPTWLQDAWASHRKMYINGTFAEDTAAFRLWTDQIIAAEMAFVNAAPAAVMVALEKHVTASRQHFERFAAARGGTVPPADPETLKSVQTFVSAWGEQVLTAAPGAQRAAGNKLLDDFTKAHAKTAPEAVHIAVSEVARTTTSIHFNNLEPLARLLAAYPQVPTTPQTELLQTLADLANKTSPQEWSPVAAQRMLRIALATHQAAQAIDAWPWTQAVVNDVWNQQVHGEVLLAARGYVPLSMASDALQNAESNAFALQSAITAIERAQLTRNEALVLLPGYLRLVKFEPSLQDNWLQGVAALRELDQALHPPAIPATNNTSLRRQIDGLNRYRAALQSALTQLRRPLTADMVAQRIAECVDQGADARDLRAAQRLLASPQLGTVERSSLTKAYRELALRLDQHSLENMTLSDGEYAKPISKKDRHAEIRMQIAHAWRAIVVAEQHASGQEQFTAQRDQWLIEAERYRKSQWQLATKAGTDDGTPRATWLSSGINIAGPFVCADLSSQQPYAALDIQWQQRDLQASPVSIFLASPSPELSVTPVNKVSANEAVRLQLQWKPQPEATSLGEVRGFLLGLESAGRTYFAPIALPHLNDQATVTLTLSSSPTQCIPVENPLPLPASGQERSLYLFVRNLAAQPTQVQISSAGVALGAPLTLAPQTQVSVALPAPGTPLHSAATPLLLQAIEVTQQKVIGEASYTFSIRQPDDLATVLQAQLASDPKLGVSAQVNVQAAQAIEVPVPLILSFHDVQQGSALRVMGGRLQAALTPASDHVALHATGIHAGPGERVQALLNVDGVPGVLMLQGVVPGLGATAPLILVTAPSLSLAGPSVSTPLPTYPLELSATNAPLGSQLRVQLLSATGQGGALLERTLPAHAEPTLNVQATTPPGGWSVGALVRRGGQTFDTAGIVGGYVWQAELVDQAGKTITTNEMPVVFDNSPPVAARFVRPPMTAVKGTLLSLQTTAWDDLSGITSVKYFVGPAVDDKPPPTAKLIDAKPSIADNSIWIADLPLPAELGPCTITAVFTNGAGLTTLAMTSVDIKAESRALQGNIQGVVLEGNRPQPALEVILLHAKGGEVARTTTTASGVFAFEQLPPGEYQLTAFKAASQRKAASNAKVQAGQTANVTLKLSI